MTKRMIENRVKKLSALEEQIAQLQEQVDAIKGELKADLTVQMICICFTWRICWAQGC